MSKGVKKLISGVFKNVNSLHNVKRSAEFDRIAENLWQMAKNHRRIKINGVKPKMSLYLLFTFFT